MTSFEPTATSQSQDLNDLSIPKASSVPSANSETDTERLDLHNRVVAALRASTPAPVVRMLLDAPTTAKLDLSLDNPIVAANPCRDNTEISELLTTVLASSSAPYGIGGYNEKRGWYARGEQFTEGTEVRSIHLGVDVWAPPGDRNNGSAPNQR